jgi:uncharacterized protein YhaN
VKIQGWFVERFGALRNYEVRDLPGGLTVFCGPNGSGKSTLVSFIRQMLFGLRSDDNGWTGRLHCATSDGTYTFTRKPDLPVSVARPDGGIAGEVEIEHLFGGPDGRSLGSLLTFDISDLQAPPSLGSSGVRDRLFPPGAGRAVRAIQRALDGIESRKVEIAERAGIELQRMPFTPVELQTRIERSTRAAARLGQLLQSQSQAQLAVEHRVRAIADLKTDIARYDALVDLAPVWKELMQARRDLATVEAVEPMPSDAEQRLEQALVARQAAQRTVSQLVVHEPGRRESTVALADPPVRSGGAGDRVNTVVRQRVQLQEPPASTEELNGWQRRLKEAVEAARESEREFEAAAQSVRDLENVRNEIAATLSRPEPPSLATLDEEARLVQHVRMTLDGLGSLQTHTKRWQDQIASQSTTIRNLESHVGAIPSIVLMYLAWCAGLAGIGTGAWRYLERDMAGVGLLAAGSFICLAGALLQRVRRKKALAEDEERRNTLETARGELERACQSLLHHQERATRRRYDISVDSVRLGLPPMPTELQLKEREAEVEAHRRQRTEWDEARSALEENRAAISRSEELRRQRAQALAAAQAHERQTVQQWNQWKVHAGLADSGVASRPSSDGIRSEAELLETCRRLRIQIAEWEQSATEWNTRARAALVGIAEPEAALAATGSPVAVAQPVADSSPALQAARRRLRICEEAVTQLLSQAGVSDEHAFRARVATSHRRAALTETIRTCEMRCNDRLRREGSADAIQRELGQGNVEEWRRRASRCAAELADLEVSRDDIMRQLRQLDADIAAAIAESADLAVLETERAALTAEALATVRASRTLAIAGSLLEDARRHADRESQPPALRRASEALSAITFSRYERVATSEDQRELVVLDSRNGWMPASQLSRGTLEQLYFSVRVGLADESAQRGPRFPIIVDDVIDHFDPKRSHAMARQMVELSRRHQIFVFTRRPETCDLLRSLEPKLNVVTMQEL